MALTIILVDRDEKYLMPLELKFIEEFQYEAEIMVITDKDYLIEYFSSPKSIDILVINEELYSEDFERHNIVNTFILTEDNDVSSTGNISVNKIYKYTSVKEILSEVISNLSFKSLLGIEGNNSTKVLMVYSPIGGAGTTLVSMGIAAALSKCHKRVLFISTETLQSFNFIFKNKDFLSNGFEKHLIYHEEEIMEHFKDSIHNEGFDYLLPFKQSTCSFNIKMEDYIYLIDKIKSSKIYDFIVIDTTSDLTIDKTSMMNYSNKVITITRQDQVSKAKLERFLFNIDCSDRDKFIFICNKYDSGKTNHLIKEELINKCMISEYISEFKFDDTNFNLDFLASDSHFKKLAYMFI